MDQLAAVSRGHSLPHGRRLGLAVMGSWAVGCRGPDRANLVGFSKIFGPVGPVGRREAWPLFPAGWHSSTAMVRHINSTAFHDECNCCSAGRNGLGYTGCRSRCVCSSRSHQCLNSIRHSLCQSFRSDWLAFERGRRCMGLPALCLTCEQRRVRRHNPQRPQPQPDRLRLGPLAATRSHSAASVRPWLVAPAGGDGGPLLWTGL